MHKEKDKRREVSKRSLDRHAENHQQFLQSVIDSVSDPIIFIGTDFRIKLANRAANEFVDSIKRASSENLTCHEFVFGHDKPCFTEGLPCPLLDVMESLNSVTVEHSRHLEDGSVHDYEILASPLFGDEGMLLGIAESFRDVTIRKKREKKLQKGQEKLEEVVKERTSKLLKINTQLRQEIEERKKIEGDCQRAREHAELLLRVAPSAIFTVDMERRITSWNDKAELITGYSRDEVMGKPCLLFSEKPCSERCGLFDNNIPKPILDAECTIRAKDGSLKIISKNVDFLHDIEGNVIGGIECFKDFTPYKKVEGELRAERDKLKGMLAALGQGMHIVSKDYDIEYQNDVLRKLFGDKIGHKCYEVYKQREIPCEVCRMHEAVNTKQIQRTEEKMANGRYYEQAYAPFVDVDGESKVLIMLRDITEEKAHQAETMRAGQLASIGELAAGVAHEINNPINGIINYAQVLLDDMKEVVSEKAGSGESEAKDLLHRIISEGERIAGIVSNLLSFSRQQKDKVEDVNVADVIEDAIALIRHQLLKDGIDIAMFLSETLPMVRVNRQQLQQVFLNLLSNARYALNKRYKEKNEHKKIEIHSEKISQRNRKYIRLTFTDWGCGIPDEIREHIFEPFFTVKEPGEGTGLGLSISHGLVKDFQGFLRVESEVDSYTRMIVDLPLLERDLL